MIKGNFLGAAIVAIIYTVYILMNSNVMPLKNSICISVSGSECFDYHIDAFCV